MERDKKLKRTIVECAITHIDKKEKRAKKS